MAKTKEDQMNLTSKTEDSEPQAAELVKPESVALATDPGTMLAQAQQSGATPEELEKWMALYERWEAREAKKAYFAAMAEFQAKCPVIPKTKEVNKRDGSLLYRYAPLDKILEITGPIEKACGFIHRFDTEPRDGGGAIVACIVSHIDGHSETTTVSIPATSGQNTNASQDQGIVITYGRRYSYEGAFGITSAYQDIDARLPVEMINDDQLAELQQGFNLVTPAVQKGMLGWAKIERLEDMPAEKYDEAMEALNAHLDRIANAD